MYYFSVLFLYVFLKSEFLIFTNRFLLIDFRILVQLYNIKKKIL